MEGPKVTFSRAHGPPRRPGPYRPPPQMCSIVVDFCEKPHRLQVGKYGYTGHRRRIDVRDITEIYRDAPDGYNREKTQMGKIDTSR